MSEAMLVGYVRDSSASQPLELQLKALSDAGCVKIFSEQGNVAPANGLDMLQRALDFVLDGDTIVFTGLDCLGPSPDDIQSIIARFIGRGVGFRCLD